MGRKPKEKFVKFLKERKKQGLTIKYKQTVCFVISERFSPICEFGIGGVKMKLTQFSKQARHKK